LAIILQRRGVPNERDLLALHCADAAKKVAAERGSFRRSFGMALVAVSKKPVVDAVAGSRRGRENQIAAVGSQRGRCSVAVDQHIRPLVCRRKSKPESRDNKTESPGVGPP